MGFIEFSLVAVAGLTIANIIITLTKKSSIDIEALRSDFQKISAEITKIESNVKDDFFRNREENQKSAKETREELSNSFRTLGDTLSKYTTDKFELFAKQLQELKSTNEEKIEKLIHTNNLKQNEFKEQLVASLKDSREEFVKSARETKIELTTALKSFEEKFTSNVKGLQEENSKKLEEMRVTVDEKLQSTVEKRFNESFKLISDRLEQVHKGLGEMQNLASGVGDLKKVLTNVKTRGVLGEIQLGAILEQYLSPEQYEQNAAVKKGSQERVEYVVRFPGKNDDNKPLLLPIDSKFPNEDYQRLLEAYDNSTNLDPKQLDIINKQFEAAVKKNAKDIKEKYINPPETTDFAIMFVPTEGLYAEIVRRTGLFEVLQRDYKIIVVGPTNLVALLNSLQMGFKTLAVEKRSSEVWQVLGAIKTEFGTFGNILGKTKKKLQEAANTIDMAETRTRVIERKLKNVQELPAQESSILLGEVLGLEDEVEEQIAEEQTADAA
jgi:DNA recombination protein RmuC